MTHNVQRFSVFFTSCNPLLTRVPVHLLKFFEQTSSTKSSQPFTIVHTTLPSIAISRRARDSARGQLRVTGPSLDMT